MDQVPWWVWIVAVCFSGQWLSAMWSNNTLQKRVLDLEIRLHKLQAHLGVAIDANPPITDDVRMLARTPGSKIAAIRLYRQQTGAGLKEAKDAVERMADMRQ
jgi:adenylosuccinate lyase